MHTTTLRMGILAALLLGAPACSKENKEAPPAAAPQAADPWRLPEGWSVDRGVTTATIYATVDGQRRLVDRDVTWSTRANECVMYEALRSGSGVVFAAAPGRSPITVAETSYDAPWQTTKQVRRYRLRYEGSDRVVEVETLNAYDVCETAKKAEPFHDGWAAAVAPSTMRPESELIPIHAETGGGNTQLHAALAAGDEALVEVLLSAGLAADAPGERGITPLMAASRWARSPAVLNRLLQTGVFVDATDNNGDTALMHAVRANAVEQARVLLTAGASVSIRNKEGQSAADLAARSNSSMQALIAEAGRGR